MASYRTQGGASIAEDLGGTASAPTVEGLQGEDLPDSAASTLLKRNSSNDGWETVPYSGSNLTTDLAGKAASSHSHAQSDVTDLIDDLAGLATDIAGKADSSHTHAISDVTNLQTSLDGKAATSHEHVMADITDLAVETDIAGMTAATDYKALTDYLPAYDASAAANRKFLFRDLISGRNLAVVSEECWDTAKMSAGMTTATSGSGTIANTPAESGYPGEFLVTFTNSNDGGSVKGSYNNGVKLGGGKWRFLAIIKAPANLSDGTNTYEIRAGLNDGGMGAEGNDVVAFFYSHGTNSGNWSVKTRDNGGSTTTTDTGVAVVANTWYALEWETNAANTSVQAYINGSAAGGAITGGLGTAGNGTLVDVQAYKTAGTSARTMTIDFVGLIFEPTTAR